MMYPAVILVWRLPRVLSKEETIQILIEQRMSMARFGDGEFLYIVDKLDLPFQRYNEDLAQRLSSILRTNNKNLLVGLPSGYHRLDDLTKEGRSFWRSQIAWVYPRLYRYIDHAKIYGNASITRLYYEVQDKETSKRQFSQIKGIWNNREVLIIEGEKSRLGVGNDLFTNTISVRRILAPAHNAFDKFDLIVANACKFPTDKLILVALGPTAKAVVSELCDRGYQAIDIGNIDIEYEWYRMGATEKVKVRGKYTSEASGGTNVEDIDDKDYQHQIEKLLI